MEPLQLLRWLLLSTRQLKKAPLCAGSFCIVVGDANGQSLAYVYSRENANDAAIAKVLTEDEARRIAANIAKLPSLLTHGSQD